MEDGGRGRRQGPRGMGTEGCGDRGGPVARGGPQASVELSCDTDVNRSPSVIIPPPKTPGRREPVRPRVPPACWSGAGARPARSCRDAATGPREVRLKDVAPTGVRTRCLGRAGLGQQAPPWAQRRVPSSSVLVLGPPLSGGGSRTLTGPSPTLRVSGAQTPATPGKRRHSDSSRAGGRGSLAPPAPARVWRGRSFQTSLQTSASGLVSPRNGRGSACRAHAAGPWDSLGCDLEVPWKGGGEAEPARWSPAGCRKAGRPRMKGTHGSHRRGQGVVPGGPSEARRRAESRRGSDPPVLPTLCMLSPMSGAAP